MFTAVQLSRPAAVLLGLSALLCFLLAASSVPYAFTLDAGVIAFYVGLGALYPLAALRIWRREKSGAWVLVVVLLLCAADEPLPSNCKPRNHWIVSGSDCGRRPALALP